MTHGTRPAYRQGCRCLPCKAASARARARYRLQPAPLVPVDLTRAYLSALAEKGLGVRQQAKLAGVSRRTVEKIRNGQASLVHARIVTKLLAVKPALAFGCRVPAIDTLRCLWLLLEEGYTQPQLARYLGRADGRIPLPRTGLVTVRTAARIRAVTRRLVGEEAENP